MGNEQPNHNITNGGNGVHDGVFVCHACDNRPFPSHMDLLRHLLGRHGQQPAAVQAPVPPPPPPPANNDVPEEDESSDDELVIILDPQPPLGAHGNALLPQDEPQNGPVADGHVLNEPPQVEHPAVENNAGIQHPNGHVANGAHD